MTIAKPPGPLNGDPTDRRHVASGMRPRIDSPAPVGLNVRLPIFASPPPQVAAAQGKALIVIGNGHDDLKKGVRYPSDEYLEKAARSSFAPHTKGMAVSVKRVNSAKEMKELIAGDRWDVVVYFGHGVMNQMALAPDEKGAPLKKDDLVAALKAAKTGKVYLYGCRAGYTGLARQVSAELPGTTVYGSFPVLDVDWEQGKEPDGDFYNRFKFKEPLTEYSNGYQTKDGVKLKRRRAEMKDPIDLAGDPLAEPTVAQ